MKRICEFALCLAVASPMFALPAAQTPASQPTMQATPSNQASPTWTVDQAVTCSVSEAWALGGRTEPGFFAIVKALAELSAQKRDMTLPNNREVGHKFGLYIKSHAKLDHDQLLYAIVDQAVRLYGTKSTSTSGK